MVAIDRTKLVLFLATSVASVLIGFLLVPPSAALRFVQYAGYYVALAGVLGFTTALVRLQRDPATQISWSRADSRLAAISLAVAVLWQANGIHGFKILMDEYVLNATAMSMHFDREVFVPLKTHEVNGIYATLGGIVDKRPLLFPLLLSFLHDLTGYRQANVFVLNGVLSAVLLFLAGKIGRRLGNSECAGILAVVLLAGLPLLAINATGAGFELLNLLMLSSVILLAAKFTERPNERTLDALVFSAVLLAQARYESALYIFSTGMIIVFGWIRMRRIIVSWGVVAAPALLVLIPLQNKVFQLNHRYWQLHDGIESPFHPQFFANNLGHALNFFTGTDDTRLSSPVLAAAGLACLLFVLTHGARRFRGLAADPAAAAFMAVAIVGLLNFGLLMFYHWGQLDDYVASRLSLPLFLFFSVATSFSVGRWVRGRGAWVPILAIPLFWMIGGCLPIVSRSQATKTSLTYNESKWQSEIVDDNKRNRILYVMRSPLPAIVKRQPAMPVEALAERAKEMAFHLAERTYQEVYVFQRMQFDPATRELCPDERSQLGPEFILETIEERRFKPLHVTRLSRIVDVDLARAEPRPPDWEPRFPPFKIVPEERESRESAFIREYLEMLP